MVSFIILAGFHRACYCEYVITISLNIICNWAKITRYWTYNLHNALNIKYYSRCRHTSFEQAKALYNVYQQLDMIKYSNKSQITGKFKMLKTVISLVTVKSVKNKTSSHMLVFPLSNVCMPVNGSDLCNSGVQCHHSLSILASCPLRIVYRICTTNQKCKVLE